MKIEITISREIPAEDNRYVRSENMLRLETYIPKSGLGPARDVLVEALQDAIAAAMAQEPRA